MKIVILGSLRKSSNTERALTKAKLLESDNSELVNLLDYKIELYNYKGIYSKEDQFLQIVNKMKGSKSIVFATPVYWYSMSSLMKVFFDRLTDLITTGKPLGRDMEGKSLSVFVTGSDSNLPEGFEVPFESTAKYFAMKFEGVLYKSIK